MAEVARLGAGGVLPHDVLRRAAAAACRGEVVAFPTDTVYGLGCSALSPEGVGRIYRIKGRSPDKLLPLLAATTAEARRWVEWSPQAEALARRFWPGGLTLVLKANAAGRDLALSPGPTLAVRVPGHPVARALLEASGVPWASTSANRAGEPPLAGGEEVARAFGAQLAFVIDAGPAAGRESSVADASAETVRVLREGPVSAAEIFSTLAANPHRILFVCTGNTCRSVMAEFLLDKLARDRGLGLRARSAGFAAERHGQVPPGVRTALESEGIPVAEHVPQVVSRELLDWADLVLVMERAHRDMLLDRWPEFRAKIHTLKGHAARPGPEDIADPIGRTDPVYAACCREIKESLEAILNPHAPHAQNPRS